MCQFLDCTIYRVGLILLLLFLLDCQAQSERTVDRCGAVHGEQGRVGSLTAISHNVVVETDNAENYDGDAGRFKRITNLPGTVSYMSARGFESIEVIGYVSNVLPRRSWSLNITSGRAASTGNGENMFRLRDRNLQRYTTRGGSDNWQRFRVEVQMGNRCPRRVNLILDGLASNNEYPGSVRFSLLCTCEMRVVR